jgi:NitT/TauT family transport system ATP-binding protein
MLEKSRSQTSRSILTGLSAARDGTAPTRESDTPRLQNLPSGEHPTDRALLRLDGVCKIFSNDLIALDGVDLKVWPGEFVTFLGPSGCGKSTLLRLIAGLTTPSKGRFAWLQSDHDGSAKQNRSIGFVFQEPTLLPWRNVADNVYLPLQLAGLPKSELRERIMEVLAQVGLAGFADAYPRELSGGMKMRVSIARALLTNPHILLMDEPFAALDEITRTKLNNDLLELFAAKHLTVIFVTHSVYESVFLSSRIVVMSARPGRVSTEIVIDAPYPRSEDYRMSPPYNDYCRCVSDALRRAMAETPVEPE